MKSFVFAWILMGTLCLAQDHTVTPNHGLEKTTSQEIVFVPLSAIQPQSISKPLSKKAVFALVTIAGFLGKLLVKNSTIPLLELIASTFNLLMNTTELEENQNKSTDSATEQDLQDTLAVIAQFLSEHAQEILEL